MNFSEALEAMKNGAKIKRAAWGGYWFIDQTLGWVEGSLTEIFTMGHWIIAFTKDGKYEPATPYQEDILSSDWMVVE